MTLRWIGSLTTCTALLALAFAVALPSARSRATSAGPLPGLSGVPEGGGFAAEMTCVSCHASASLNPDERGALALQGLPDAYDPGRRYSLRFELRHPDEALRRWGFQLSAVSAQSFRGAGHFVVTDPARTQVVAGTAEREYVEHTYNGTAIGQSGGTSWSFDWVAPEGDVGAIAFYGSGNASNVDGSQNGDLVFNPTPEPLAKVAGPGGKPGPSDDTSEAPDPSPTAGP